MISWLIFTILQTAKLLIILQLRAIITNFIKKVSSGDAAKEFSEVMGNYR